VQVLQGSGEEELLKVRNLSNVVKTVKLIRSLNGSFLIKNAMKTLF
jgi:hypothetical protein